MSTLTLDAVSRWYGNVVAVNDVTFEHSSLLERLLRCGTLVVESAGERGQLVLRESGLHDLERQVDHVQLAEPGTG